MNKRFYLLLAVFALIAWAIVTLFRHDAEVGPERGTQAPQFSLSDREGRQIKLQDYRGKAVLINFWATWCGPCRHEMPSLEQLYKKFEGEGFEIIGISLDEEGWGPVDAFLKVVPVSFPIVLDHEQLVSEKYQTYRIPETYLIDKDGKIADKFVGPQDYNRPVFYKAVERVLSKKVDL